MKHGMMKGQVVIGLAPTCRCPSFPDEENISPIGLNFAEALKNNHSSYISLMVTYQVVANCPECGAPWDIRTVDAI